MTVLPENLKKRMESSDLLPVLTAARSLVRTLPASLPHPSHHPKVLDRVRLSAIGSAGEDQEQQLPGS
ncbi:MAG: hypothetical protein ABSH28_25460 [Acidobacteriota bacterium]